MKKFLHFSTNDLSLYGGAYKASYQLHSALRTAGCSSRMIVRTKISEDKDVYQIPGHPWEDLLQNLIKIRRWLQVLPVNGKQFYSFNFDLPSGINSDFFYNDKFSEEVDVLCFHLITSFLNIKTIRNLYNYYQRPLVWVLMDLEPLTGGCHYSFGCDGFTRQCGTCPLLRTSFRKDRSQVVWKRKYNYLKDLPITFVAPTSWLKAKVYESSLFKNHRVEIIPLAIDIENFRPVEKQIARQKMSLPLDKKLIFIGAASLEDPRKGMSYLREALQQLSLMIDASDSILKREDILLVIASRPSEEKFCKSLPIPNQHIGYLKEPSQLALMYQSADLFVCPSIEDAGPMMIPESMLCGTPVVAFNTGGAPDLIETMKTGYLAAYKDSSDLAQGIYSLLAADNISAIQTAAYEVALKQHSPARVAERYLALYDSLLNNHSTNIKES